MTGKDAPVSTRYFGRWRTWLATLATLAAIAAIGFAFRGNVGPETASAQAPSAGSGLKARPASGATTARPVSGNAKGATTRPPATNAAKAGATARPAGNATAQPNPATLQVMAVVNGEQITRTELGRECIRRYGEEVLESMVNRHLIAAACAQQGVTITEQDVNDEVSKIATRFGLDRERWLQLLQEERGFGEAQYKNEVVWPTLALRQLAAAETDVAPEEIKKAFEAEFGPKVQARLIAVSQKPLADQLRAQAAANPASFGELSKKHSEDPGVAAAYGVIPPIRMHLGDANLEQVAFSLKEGEISPVVQVANMHYIIKCEKHLPQQQLFNSQQLAQQQARLKEKLKENKLRLSAGKFFDDMRKQAQVEVILNDQAKQQQQPGIAALVNGKSITVAQLADECIARHGSDVLDGEINRKLLQQELNRKKAVVGEADIDSEVARAAESYGHVNKQTGQPDVEGWLKKITEQDGATVDLYVRDAVWPSVALKKLVGGNVQVSQEDLQKAFEANYGERVEVLAIVLGDHRQAQKVWDMARNNPTDAYFGELAQQYSVEPSSRSNGGKVPPIPRHGGSPLIEEEAFRLKGGELSGIIAVDKQFIILRCLGRTKPVQVNLQEVQGDLARDIQEKKLRVLMTKEFDRLREAAQIDNFLANVSQPGKRTASLTGALPANPAAKAPAGPTRVAPASATLPRGAGPQSR